MISNKKLGPLKTVALLINLTERRLSSCAIFLLNLDKTDTSLSSFVFPKRWLFCVGLTVHKY